MITSTVSAMASDSQLPYDEEIVWSDMTMDEKLQLIENRGIEIPEDYREFIVTLIEQVEKDSNFPVAVSNPIAYDLGTQVKNVVNSYCQQNNYLMVLAAAYTLQDSSVIGGWDETYQYYNCYAYAVGRSDGFYWPGKFSTCTNKSDFKISDSIYSMACDVRTDLMSNSFSNKCVVVTTTRPSSLSSGQSCICIRKGDVDFHFMKLSGSAWYHKPSGTQLLKYKFLPTTSMDWTNERVVSGVAYPKTTVYDSSIYYIIYSQDHGATTYTSTGQNYHSGSRHFYQYGQKCDCCGVYTTTSWTSRPCSGPPCGTTMSLTLIPEVM